MPKRELKIKPAFTLIELMVAIVLAAVVISGVGIILADSQRGWHDMYNCIYADVVTDSYVAKKTFDSVIRRACKSKGILLDPAGSWVEVCYYAATGSTTVDRYARFYVSGGKLNLQRGTLNPKQALTETVLCENVSACVFKSNGRSVQMIITLDNGQQNIAFVSSAVMHN